MIFERNFARGPWAADDIRARRGDWSFEQLFRDYLESYAKLHTKTWAETEANFQRYLEPFAAKKISQIHAVEVQRWHAKLGKERGRYAANRAVELMRAVINWGLKTRRIERTRLEGAENPAKDIQPFGEKARSRFLQADELPRFFQALIFNSLQSRHGGRVLVMRGRGAAYCGKEQPMVAFFSRFRLARL
jgi:hypothetical protein